MLMNIKEKIKKSGCRQWEVAEVLNINESTFTRWLRRPENLNSESIKRINSAIDEIKNKQIAR